MKHTSVPWSLRDIPHQGLTIEWKEGAPVCHMRWTDGLNKQTEERVKADAQFIVKAVNNHYKLVEALNYAKPHLKHFKTGKCNNPNQCTRCLVDKALEDVDK